MTRVRILLLLLFAAVALISNAQPVAQYVVKGDTNLAPVNVCRQYITLFEDISLGQIASVSWTFQNGNPSTSTNSSVAVVWNTNGSKSCSLTVTDTGGQTNTINFTVVVDNTKPTANFGAIPDFCSSDPATLLTQGVPAGGTYFGPGVGDNKFDAGVADTGTHIIGYAYTAPNGCTDTAYSSVYVKPGPKAKLLELNNFSNCNGFSFANPDFEIELYGQSTSPDSIIHHELIWGDGSAGWDSASFRDGITHTYVGQGIYQLQYVVTGGNGCTDTAKYLVLNTTNPASLNMSNPGGTNGCAPVTVSFPLTTTNTDTTIVYNIDWGDGSDTTFKHPPPAVVTHTYDTTSCIQPSGFFNITATATNACVFTTSTLQGPFVTQPGKAEFLNPPGCVGVPHTLNNMSIPGFTNACSRLSTYIWDYGDGSPPVTQVVSTPVPPPGVHTWTTPGVYNVTLILVSPAGNCPGDTLSLPVCIEDSVSASVSVTSGAGCLPLTPTIVNTSDTTSFCTPVQRGWMVDPPTGWTLLGGDTLTDYEPEFSFVQPGSYTLSYYQFNGCGGDTISSVINVNGPPSVNLAQNLPPYCDTVYINTQTNSNHNPNTASNGSPVTSYFWEITPSVPFLNVTSATSQFPEFILPPNTYTIKNWATNACGTDSTEQTVVVNALTNGGFISSTTKGCSPLSVAVQSTSTLGVQHTWYIDTIMYSTARDTTMILTNTGTVDSVYQIKLVVYSGQGCSDTIRQNVTVYPSPSAGFMADSTCIGGPISFTDTSRIAVAPLVDWYWQFGDGNTSTQQNPQHTYGVPGKYVATLTVTDSNGCQNAVSDSVHVFSDPIAHYAINYSSLPDSVCVQDTVYFTNSSSVDSLGTPIVAYNWDVFDDGSIEDTTQHYKHVFSNPGSFPVRLTVFSETGCIGEFVDTIHVSKPSVPYFTLSSYGGCTPVTVVATDSSYGYILNYNWIFYTLDSNQNRIVEYTSTQSNPNPIPPFAAHVLTNKTVFAELTVSNSCYSQTYTDTINIKPIPIPFFAFSSDTGCSPLTVNIQVDGLATGNPDSIVFNYGDGSPASVLHPNVNILPNGDTLFTWNQQTHTFTYNGSGLDTNYYVTLHAANECGDSSYTVPINVRNRSVQSFFTASTNVGCSPLGVSFTDYSFASTAISYCFDFDTIAKTCGGGVYSGPNPTYNFTTPGVYVVAQFANNACGSDTSYQIIDVRPKADVQFSFPANVCEGDSVHFVNTTTLSAGNIAGYRWDFGNGDSSFITSPTYVYDTTGTFTVCLEVITDQGCDSVFCQTISVSSKPTASFTYVNNVCRNQQPVQFVNQSSNPSGNIISYEWFFGDGNVSTQINPLHTYAAAGTYDVKLIVINTNNCPDSIIQQVTIYPVPEAAFTYNILSGDTCGVPQTINFTNASNNAGGYYWDFDNLNNPGQDTSIQMHPSYTVTAPGKYRVMLIAKNGLGCQDTAVDTINIHPLPEPDFLPNTTAGCAPLDVLFSNQTKLPTGFNDAMTFEWFFGDGTTATGEYGAHTYIQPGTYSVKLVATTENACNDSITLNNIITVFPVPTGQFNWLPVEFGVYQFNQISTGGTPPYTYQWDFGDGNTSTQENPQHEFEIDRVGFEKGFYTCLTITDANGCDSTICDTVDLGAFTLFVPNAMSPDSEGEEALFLPKGQGLESYECLVFDRWGNLLWKSDKLSEDTASPIEAWDGTYKGQPVPPGVYIWRIKATFANGVVWRGQNYTDEDKVANSGTITILR